jgi:hypothetical protein
MNKEKSNCSEKKAQWMNVSAESSREMNEKNELKVRDRIVSSWGNQWKDNLKIID